MTAWPAGWRGRLVALPLVIEIAYDLFIQAVFVKGVVDMVLGRRAHWGHVDRAALNDPVDFGSHRSVNGVGLAALVVPVGLTGGVLLDHDVLTSPFVEALALIVAVNTLIYAALSIGKLIPRRTA